MADFPLSDAAFAQGHTHTVCQDYALARGGMVALSDGCSSSPHTDVGARLWVHTALAEPQHWHEHDGEHAGDVTHWWVERLPTQLNLPARCLDATLLVAVANLELRGVMRQAVDVVVFGDGVVFGRRRDGSGLDIRVVEFPSGAPLYLSYKRDPARLAQFRREFGAHYVVTETRADGFTHEIRDDRLGRFSLAFAYGTGSYDLVGVASDGVRAFTRPDGTGAREAVPVGEVLAELVRIPVVSPGFATRRLRAFLAKTCPEHGWRPEDDVSVGMIALGAP